MLSSSLRVFIAPGATDLRKSFEGLSGVTRESLGQDPLSGDWFVFCNRSRNRIRILYFDGSGFWILAKRLEQGTFAWPATELDQRSLEITSQELMLLVAGIDLSTAEKRRWYGRESEGRQRRRA